MRPLHMEDDWAGLLDTPCAETKTQQGRETNCHVLQISCADVQEGVEDYLRMTKHGEVEELVEECEGLSEET